MKRKLMEQQKLPQDIKENLASKLESEEAHANQAILEIEELKKKNAVLEGVLQSVQEKIALLEANANKNGPISSTKGYYIRSGTDNVKLGYFDSSSEGLRVVNEPHRQTSRYKLKPNADGTVGIYATFLGKFIIRKPAGDFGLTENCNSSNGKFELDYVGMDEKQQHMVKIRLLSGYNHGGYLGARGGHAGICQEAELFTLVPINDCVV